MVSVIRGAIGGLDAGAREIWHQGRSDVAGESENGDHFGAALAAADFTGDGRADLAIGIPGEDFEHHFGLSRTRDAGRLMVLCGSAGGLRVLASSDIDRARAGIEGGRNVGDLIGITLSVGDFNIDGLADVVVGVPGEDVTMIDGEKRANAGAAQILYGQANGIAHVPDSTRQRYTDSRVPTNANPATAGDGFGGSLP